MTSFFAKIIVLERCLSTQDTDLGMHSPKKIIAIANQSTNIFPTFVSVTSNFHAYSAYWDVRFSWGNFVRILGLIRYELSTLEEINKYKWNGKINSTSLNFICFLWYDDYDIPAEGNLKAFIYEEGKLKYVGVHFLCFPPSEKQTGRSPYAVSVLPKSQSNYPHKLIRVQNLNKYKNTTTICVRPLYGPYNDKLLIAQFIIYYHRILSINNFIFYDMSITNSIRQLIERLHNYGINIDLLSWNLPTGNITELWDFGTLTALNDCVYRSVGKYVIVVDLDEFVVVQNKKIQHVGQLYQDVLENKKGKIGDAVLFLNRFFCYEYASSMSNFSYKNSLSTQRTVKFLPILELSEGERRLWPPRQRSKMLLFSNSVVAIGHHHVLQFIDDSYKNIPSPQSLAVMQHYRKCKDIRYGVHAKGSTVLKYKSQQFLTLIHKKKRILSSPLWKVYEK